MVGFTSNSVCNELTGLARLAINAFRDILRIRQSKYGELLEWLGARIERLKKQEAVACQRMKGIICAQPMID